MKKKYQFELLNGIDLEMSSLKPVKTTFKGIFLFPKIEQSHSLFDKVMFFAEKKEKKKR